MLELDLIMVNKPNIYISNKNVKYFDMLNLAFVSLKFICLNLKLKGIISCDLNQNYYLKIGTKLLYLFAISR